VNAATTGYRGPPRSRIFTPMNKTNRKRDDANHRLPALDRIVLS
jgi:hypothetical protein